MGIPDEVRGRLSQAASEAQRVHDSPLRADALAAQVAALARTIAASDAPGELKGRLAQALADAERVLRRDDDGREAARHLQAALRLLEPRPRAPNPFGDD